MKYLKYNNIPDFFIDVRSKFVYNYYDQNECLTNDNDIIINNDEDVSTKNIQLDINIRSKYDNRAASYLQNIDLSYYKAITNKSLQKNDIFYFNLPHKQNLNNKNIYLDKLQNEIANIDTLLGISNSNNTMARNFILSNKKVSIEKSYFDNFVSKNKSFLFTEKNKSDLKKHDLIFSSFERDVNESEFVLNENIVPFNSKSIYSQKYSGTFYIQTGVLVEKYLKIEKNNYKKLNSFFRYNNIDSDSEFIDNLNSNSDTIYNFNTSIIDSGVKYGKTYMYIVYPVYQTSCPKKNDYHVFEDFIMCGYPYFTEEITCTEKKRPIPPVDFTFRYVDNSDSLKITWKKPLELQNDIKGYQIFKRFSLEDPFVLISQIESHTEKDLYYTRNENISASIVSQISNSLVLDFYDKNFKKEKINIYSICTIDAHGFVSNYSSQYAIKFDAIRKKCIIDLISGPGAPLHMPNLLVPRKTIFYNNDDKVVSSLPVEENVSKYTIYLTPEFKQLETEGDSLTNILEQNNYFYDLNALRIEDTSLYTSRIKINNFINESE